MTDRDLLEALRACFVPGSRSDIVAANLVRSATLTPDHDAPGAGIPGVPRRFVAHVTLTAPSADEAVASQLQAQVENRLAGIESISRAEITMVPPLFAIL
jgi:hypothetical protein